MAALLLQLAAIAIFALSSVNGAKIDIVNQCGQTLTACSTCCGGGQVNCFVLNSGGRKLLDVGSKWPAAVILAFPGSSGSSSVGNNAKPQANLAEFTINGANGQDYYDISNVDAYNMRMKIAPSGAGGGKNCQAIVCDVKGLQSFCKAPNKLTGAPGQGCKNLNGPGLVATSGTKAFKASCPTSYSYSKDDAGTPVFGCIVHWHELPSGALPLTNKRLLLDLRYIH